MRKYMFVFVAYLLPIVNIPGASSEDHLGLEYSITMPSVDVVEGSLAVPAPLDLLTLGLIKIFQIKISTETSPRQKLMSFLKAYLKIQKQTYL